jgi:hypothetical protein
MSAVSREREKTRITQGNDSQKLPRRAMKPNPPAPFPIGKPPSGMLREGSL